jgi:divalent metal cation (Fe/Co/Zn/Cd) transporter
MVHDYGPGRRFASVHVEMDRNEDPLLCHELIDNLERECWESHGIQLVIHYDPVVTDDPELDRMRSAATAALKDIDSRLSLHDFRMVQGKGHTNLIFDVAVPEDLMSKKAEIKSQLDETINNNAPCTYYTVITFDPAAFN